MKRLCLLITLAGSMLAAPLYAVPVDYTFNGVIVAEFIDYTSPAITDPAQRLYSDGVAGNFALTYDSDTPVNTSDNAPFAQIFGFGTWSDYLAAGSSLSGSVGGDAFSASTADVIVADAPGSGGFLDGFFMSAGQFENPVVAGSGFSGFSFGGFDLVGFTLFTTSFQDHFLSQALPAEILNGELVTGLNLRFINQQDPQIQRIVQVAGSVSKVAEPISLFLMMMGMGLVSIRRLRI